MEKVVLVRYFWNVRTLFFGEEEILELRSPKIQTNSWGQITHIYQKNIVEGKLPT